MSEPLVLLPGMMCDARIFHPQVARFSAHRKVFVPPLTTSDNIADIASDILADLPPAFALAGFSMGGIVAMEIMRQAPDRVSRLALLDTNPLAETAARSASREPQIASVLDGGLETVMREEMKPHYLSESSDKLAILNTCMQMANALGADVFANQSRALQKRFDQTDTLAAVRVPTLILCGEDDSLCPVETHEKMRRLIQHATLSIIPGAGHMPTLEQPALTNEALSTWLNP